MAVETKHRLDPELDSELSCFPSKKIINNNQTQSPLNSTADAFAKNIHLKKEMTKNWTFFSDTPIRPHTKSNSECNKVSSPFHVVALLNQNEPHTRRIATQLPKPKRHIRVCVTSDFIVLTSRAMQSKAALGQSWDLERVALSQNCRV